MNQTHGEHDGGVIKRHSRGMRSSNKTRENTRKPGEAQECMENMSFLERPKNFLFLMALDATYPEWF
jgi:hypothetical protein